MRFDEKVHSLAPVDLTLPGDGRVRVSRPVLAQILILAPPLEFPRRQLGALLKVDQRLQKSSVRIVQFSLDGRPVDRELDASEKRLGKVVLWPNVDIRGGRGVKVRVVGLVDANFHGQVRAAQVQIFVRSSRNVELDVAGGGKREARLNRRVPPIEDRCRDAGSREKIESRRRCRRRPGDVCTAQPYPLSSAHE